MTEPIRGPLTIAIVDDEPIMRELLLRLFREFQVEGFATGTTLLKRLRDGGSFDALVTDVMMPEMSGCALHACLQREFPRLAERTIFVTAGATTTESLDFLTATRQPVVSKPFSRVELRDLVTGIARHP